MMLLQTIVAFIVVLGTLIVVHELGHYWVARWCGVKVLRFSVGMGKVVFSRRWGRDQTEWVISALPLGGYVKMLDEREQDLTGLSAEDLKREFTRQTVWRRMAIVAAGPIANFLLAIAIFAGLYHHGIPEPIPRLRAAPESTAAYQAGLRGGELITAINGEPVALWSDIHWKLLQLAVEKMPAKLDVQRPNTGSSGGNLLDTVTISLDGLSVEELEGDFLGKLGISLARSKAILGKIRSGGPGMQAGLQEGDVILEANEIAVPDGLAFIEQIQRSPEKPVLLKLMRGQQLLTLTVTPVPQKQNGQTVGQIKVDVVQKPEMATVSVPLLDALSKAFTKTWDSSIFTLKMLGKMITGEVSLKNISGPITIADYAGQSARIGMITFLIFMANISISLGVMNLLPIPILDGGLLLYYSLEVLIGRPIPKRFGEMGQRAGMGILMALMCVAFFNDIVRLIQ